MRRHLIDGLLVLALMAAATTIGRSYVDTLVASGFQPQYYQTEFGPAVMLACGHGYRNPVAAGIPVLQAFLETRSAGISCADLPATMATAPLTGPQNTWKYLLGAAGAVWWAGGEVSWPALQRLSGFLLALSVAAAYAGFRLAGGPVVATIAAIAVMTSPLHLRHLPHLRDYAKAPFMIGIGVILALLVTRRLSLRGLTGWSLAFGVVLGIGTGFRNDLLIAAPAFVVAAVFSALRHDRQRLARSAAALAAGGVGFLVAAAPVLGAYSQGGGASMPHVALLGLAGQFDHALRVDPSPVYAFGHTYSDSVVAAIVSDTAVRRQGQLAPIATYDTAYDRASNLLARSIIATLPADLWVRGLSSMVGVLQLPSSSSEDVEAPPGLSGEPQRWFEWRAQQLRGREQAIFAVVVLAFLAGMVVSPWPALMLLLLTAYMAAYPALQFHDRHYFHLNVIPVAAAAYLTSLLVRVARQMVTGPRPPFNGATVRRRAVAAVGAAALGMAILVLPLLGLRVYQHSRIRPLIESYQTAAREGVATTDQASSDGQVVIELAALPALERAARHPQTVQSELLVAEFAAAGCSAREIAFDIGYDASRGVSEFDRRLVVRRPLSTDGATLVFFPTYFYQARPVREAGPYYAVARLRLPADLRPCLERVSRVPDIAAVPLLLDVAVWPGWASARLHQAMAQGQPW